MIDRYALAYALVKQASLGSKIKGGLGKVVSGVKKLFGRGKPQTQVPAEPPQMGFFERIDKSLGRAYDKAVATAQDIRGRLAAKARQIAGNPFFQISAPIAGGAIGAYTLYRLMRNRAARRALDEE